MSRRMPTFSSEAEERAFWETNDSTEYLDWSSAQRVQLPNLKKSARTISLRLPEDLLHAIKVQANALDVPYQSLMKMVLYKAFMGAREHD